MARKQYLLIETDTFKIRRAGSNGRKDPAHYTVVMKDETYPFARRLDLTIDELFDLTNALDDICDDIEDAEEARLA